MKKVINIDAEFDNVFFDEKSIQKYTAGQKASATMKGKTLEELVGEEAAAKGKEARRQSNFKQDYSSRGVKIAATRRARGSYDGRSMRGKEHKASTKAQQSVKAKIRQDLRRSLNLGKTGKLPKDLLEAEYKKHGLL